MWFGIVLYENILNTLFNNFKLYATFEHDNRIQTITKMKRNILSSLSNSGNK